MTANRDKLTSVTLTSTGAPATAAVGTYSIVPTDPVGTGLSNYTIEFIDGSLTVNAAPATVESITIEKVNTGKHKTTQDIVVQFSEAIAMGTAQDLDYYSLVTVPKSKKQKGKTVPLASAPTAPAFTVTLRTSKALVLSPPLKLTILGAGPYGLMGLPLASNVVATLSTSGVSINKAVPLVVTSGRSAHLVDALLRRDSVRGRVTRGHDSGPDGLGVVGAPRRGPGPQGAALGRSVGSLRGRIRKCATLKRASEIPRYDHVDFGRLRPYNRASARSHSSVVI